MKYIVFPTTNSVFLAEAVIKRENINCDIYPTPVTEKVCCGICIGLGDEDLKIVVKLLNENKIEFIDVCE